MYKDIIKTHNIEGPKAPSPDLLKIIMQTLEIISSHFNKFCHEKTVGAKM